MKDEIKIINFLSTKLMSQATGCVANFCGGLACVGGRHKNQVISARGYQSSGIG